MKTIHVRYNEFNNWEQPIGVTQKDDGEIIWCNHADYETKIEAIGYEQYERNEKIDICQTCDKWKFHDQRDWS